MDESNKFILIKSEAEALTMYKETALKINNPFLNPNKSIESENEFYRTKNKNKKNTFKIRIDKKYRTGSLANLIGSKTQHSLDSNQLNNKNGKTYFMNKKEDNINNSKQVTFNITNTSNKNPYFYLTSPLDSIYRAIKIKKSSDSVRNSNNYMIDLIHKKEIELCLDLIKKLSANGINDAKIIDENKEGNSEETSNLIKLIKKFNFDNINNQKLIEYLILNENNNSFVNSKMLKSDLNSINDLSVSMTTNFKTNNLLYNNNLNQDNNNLSLEQNLNNSSIELKNNNSSFIQNNSNIINEKSKLMKSSSMYNISKIKEPKDDLNSQNNRKDLYKNEINFHTGFVRSQKNLFKETFKSIRKKPTINPKKIKKSKKETEKLSLPEIEEYKSIIKEIQKRKKKKQDQSQNIIEVKKDLSELDLKDKIIGELHNIYQEEKNTFLWDLHDNYGRGDSKVKYDPVKEEINANIRNINLVKRKQNHYIDGYSKFIGKVNKRLDEFNYILGNKFYDKEQKKEKEEKFHKCIEEFENKLKKYRDELSGEKKIYNKIFKQKIDFKKDEFQENYQDNNFNFDEKYIIK